MSLTPKQDTVYRFIQEFMQANSYAPTEAEIAEAIGITSRGVAHRYVNALAEAGLVNIIPNRRRNIKLVETDESAWRLPLIGNIAAGEPIEALATQEWFDVADLFKNHFLLRVKGNSMLDEGIHHGDLVICQQTETAKNGDIIVALIDNEAATLKRFYKNSDATITLIPANAFYAPLTYGAERIHIQGLYKGLFRLAK